MLFLGSPHDPDLEEEYEIVRKTALSVELEVPVYSEFKNQLFEHPEEWFAGSNGEFRNYYRIGQLAFACFLIPLSEEPNFELIDKAAQELKALFSDERIPTKLLDDYLMNLKCGEPMGGVSRVCFKIFTLFFQLYRF